MKLLIYARDISLLFLKICINRIIPAPFFEAWSLLVFKMVTSLKIQIPFNIFNAYLKEPANGSPFIDIIQQETIPMSAFVI